MKKLNNNVLFLITILLFFIMTSTYAIMKSGTNISGNIKTSAWNVSLVQNGGNNVLNISPDGQTANYTLIVRSDSEVDVNYSIVISNVPSGVSASLDGVTFKPQVNNEITFDSCGTILYSPQGGEVSHTITFKADSGTSLLNNRQINVDVITEQAL